VKSKNSTLFLDTWTHTDLDTGDKNHGYLLYDDNGNEYWGYFDRHITDDQEILREVMLDTSALQMVLRYDDLIINDGCRVGIGVLRVGR